MSDLDLLQTQLARLEAERDALRERVESERAELEKERTERAARARDAIRRTRLRRQLAASGVSWLLVAGLAIAYVNHTWFGDEQLRGQVARVRGDAPAQLGDACSVGLTSDFPASGWMSVECGGRRLYGLESFSGDIECESEGHRAVRCQDDYAIDRDGDPELRLDRRRGQLVLRDASSWRIVITLDR